MIVWLILLQILLNAGFSTENSTNTVKLVKCPLLYRTTYKEQREFEYAECAGKCYQEIRLTEITEAGQFAFLFASGCANEHFWNGNLLEFPATKHQFLKLCDKEGVARCAHRYLNGTYGGTICCENDHDDVLASWLWDIFFGENEELRYELKSTEQYMMKVRKAMAPHSGEIYLSIGFSFFVVLVFTALAFLQFYHINDGIIS